MNPATLDAAEGSILPFDQTVRARRSCRAFLPTQLPDAVIRDVLDDAQWAPSNCNTQPWQTHVVSGDSRDTLARGLHAADDAGRYDLNFSWDDNGFTGRLGERRREQGRIYLQDLGIAREDREARGKAAAANLSFFGAPHVALLFMPMVGDGVRIAGDLGMYGQTLLLALAARGLGGVPQTVLGFHARTIRETLGISDDLKLLYGISFGYPNEAAMTRLTQMQRHDLAHSVVFHG